MWQSALMNTPYHLRQDCRHHDKLQLIKYSRGNTHCLVGECANYFQLIQRFNNSTIKDTMMSWENLKNNESGKFKDNEAGKCKNDWAGK